jgi:hypothetical protein
MNVISNAAASRSYLTDLIVEGRTSWKRPERSSRVPPTALIAARCKAALTSSMSSRRLISSAEGGKGALGAVPTRTLRQIGVLHMGTADPELRTNRSRVAAFAHPTELRRFHAPTHNRFCWRWSNVPASSTAPDCSPSPPPHPHKPPPPCRGTSGSSAPCPAPCRSRWRRSRARPG